jgi:hypothetical protein
MNTQSDIQFDNEDGPLIGKLPEKLLQTFELVCELLLCKGADINGKDKVDKLLCSQLTSVALGNLFDFVFSSLLYNRVERRLYI